MGILDMLWQYRISNQIAHGLHIYKDINSPVTPLYHWLTAIPNIFVNSIKAKLVADDIIVIITNITSFQLLYPIIENKKKLLLLMSCLIFILGFGQAYNSLLILIGLLIISIQNKQNVNNKTFVIIGILSFCGILTKQTTGTMFVILESIYIISHKEKKETMYFTTGFIISGLSFLMYLLITNSISEFFDYCLFGLFQFGSKKIVSPIGLLLGIFLLSIILVGILNVKKIKNKMIIEFLGLLLSMSLVCYPILNFAHIRPLLYIGCIIVFLLDWERTKISKTFVILFSLIGAFSLCSSLGAFEKNDGKHFLKGVINVNDFKVMEIENQEIELISQQYNCNVLKISGNSVCNEFIDDNFSATPAGMFLEGNLGTKTPEEWIDNLVQEGYIIAIYDSTDRGWFWQFPITIQVYIEDEYSLIYSSNDTHLKYFVKKENSKWMLNLK